MQELSKISVYRLRIGKPPKEICQQQSVAQSDRLSRGVKKLRKHVKMHTRNYVFR